MNFNASPLWGGVVYSKLGLKPSMQMPFYVEFNVPGGTALGLHSMGDKRGKKRGGRPTGGLGIMLRVTGIQKIVAGLKRKGIRCSPVKTALGGGCLPPPQQVRFPPTCASGWVPSASASRCSGPGVRHHY